MASALENSPAMNSWSDQMSSVQNLPIPSFTVLNNKADKKDALAAAIAFSDKTDDGLNPQLWWEADLVIVGLSGMGKTPISKHLARMGFKVSNFPLVRNCHIPEELYQIDPHKVVGLMIHPDVLLTIRRERSYQWGVSLTSTFTDFGEIEDEVKWAKRLYRQNPDWRVVNTTDRDPKDVATQLSKWLCNGLGN